MHRIGGKPKKAKWAKDKGIGQNGGNGIGGNQQIASGMETTKNVHYLDKNDKIGYLPIAECDKDEAKMEEGPK
jgi:hypothetical protein